MTLYRLHFSPEPGLGNNTMTRYIVISISWPDKGHLTWVDRKDDTVEILDIAVTGERRTGIGRALVDQLLREIEGKTKKLYAITRADNYIAQQFYEALRFRGIPLRDFYGDGGIDAVMYVRDLESQA